jgi:hypothetical protein
MSKSPKLSIAILCTILTGTLLAINYYSGKYLLRGSDVSTDSSAASVTTVTLEDLKYSMFPIYKNKTESLVYFHVNSLKTKAPISDAKVSAEFIAKDGDLKKAAFSFDSTKSCFVTTLPLDHHENYRVQTVVQLSNGKIFTPVFSFHCADAFPEVEWLSSQETESK